MMSATVRRRVWMSAVLVFGVVSGITGSADRSMGMSLAEALGQVTLFSGLTDAERGALASAAVLRHGAAGERIIVQGQNLDRMTIILNGEAEVLINGKAVVTLSGQSIVGEVEFLDPLGASADVVLVNAADLIELDFTALRQLMEKHPRVGYEIMRGIAVIEARRLRATNPK